MRLTRRKLLRLIPGGAVASILAACGLADDPTPTVTPSPTPFAISPEPVARAFLSAWESNDFNTMYGLLTQETQSSISREAFEQRYRDIFNEATIYDFGTALTGAARFGVDEAGADFEVTYRTRLVGDLTFHPRLHMQRLDDEWRIAWTPAAVIPALGAENVLQIFPRTSTRGVIYDRNGEILATQGAIVTIGVVPGQIEDEGALQGLLGNILGMEPFEIAEKYADQPADWFIPIGDVAFETMQDNYDALVQMPGIAMREKGARSYPQGTLASHVVGYVGAVSAEELSALGERGYTENDLVGKMGLEWTAEELLAGKKGGRLAVLSPEGDEVATLADVAAEQSRSLYTTLDLTLQRAAEEILGERQGAIAALDVSTGAVLALASYPRFDPNAMANLLDSQERATVAAQPGEPLINRAVQGVYACGSVFKVVSMAAAMATDTFERQSSFGCSGVWERLGIPMRCWKESGHGTIDLFNGLIESCDVVFYEVGLALYNRGEMTLQEFARRFGYGQQTGIELDESSGLVPDEEWKRAQLGEGWTPGDTVNMAIGQGFLLTTPLQVARMMAAVANGGTLYQPTLYDYTEDVTGNTNRVAFEPKETGRLDIAPDALSTIQQALAGVTQPPRGTAAAAFEGFPVSVAGKTGTAETSGEDPHAWFAAYAPADQPQIAIAAMAEGAGEGSEIAAPMVREFLSRYLDAG